MSHVSCTIALIRHNVNNSLDSQRTEWTECVPPFRKGHEMKKLLLDRHDIHGTLLSRMRPTEVTPRCDSVRLPRLAMASWDMLPAQVMCGPTATGIGAAAAGFGSAAAGCAHRIEVPSGCREAGCKTTTASVSAAATGVKH